MISGFTILVGLVLAALVALAAISLVRGAVRATRVTQGEQKYEPFVDFFPPDPVVRTAGVVVVGIAAVLWGLAHLAAAAIWSATGFLVPRVVEAGIVAVYLCVSASLTGVGGAMLLASRRYGRSVVSWGQFLAAVLGYFGLAMSLALPGLRELPMAVRRASWPITAGMGAYLVLAVAIGTIAQHVGKPPVPSSL